MLCFASLSVAGRVALGHIPAAEIPLVRTAGGAVVFSVIAWRRGTLHIDRRDVPFLLLCALLGTVLNQELFIFGLARSTATNAVVLMSTIPVFTAIAAIVLGRERPQLLRLLGIAVAFGGVAALLGAEELSTSSDHLLGSAMVILNSMSYGTYLVIVRPLAQKYDPLGLLAAMFIAGLFMVAPLGIEAFANGPELGPNDYLAFAFLIAVPTVGAYSCVQIGIRRAESSVVAAYVFTQPVFVAFGAWLVLGEQVGIRTVVCGVITLFGVWLAARAR
jgi:drug/metabolite transporter (DMT)-like permease